MVVVGYLSRLVLWRTFEQKPKGLRPCTPLPHTSEPAKERESELNNESKNESKNGEEEEEERACTPRTRFLGFASSLR